MTILTGSNIYINWGYYPAHTAQPIEGYFKKLVLTRGFRTPHEVMADSGTCDITLDNGGVPNAPYSVGGFPIFSPLFQQSSSGLFINPVHPIAPRQQTTVSLGPIGGGSSQTIFTGYMVDIVPTSSSIPQKEAILKLEDLIGVLKHSKINMPLLYNRTGDNLVPVIINNALNAPFKNGTVVFTGIPSVGDVIYVLDADYNLSGSTLGKFGTYTFTNTYPCITPNSVYIGATRFSAATDFAASINQIEGINVIYGAQSALPSYVIATVYDNVPMAGQTSVVITSTLAGNVATQFSLSGSGAFTFTQPTAVADAVPMTSIDVGTQFFPNAGMQWGKYSTTAWDAIKEVTESEGGRFFVTPYGVPVWRNNARQFRQATSTFTAAPGGYTVDAGIPITEVFNHINVVITPAQTITSTVVAKATAIVAVPGQGSITVSLPFVNQTSGKAAGAKDLILPLVAGTDWVANERADGRATDYTFYAPLQITFQYRISGAQLDLTITNAATGTLYMTTLQVRGTLLVQDNPITMDAFDASSINLYGYNDTTTKLTLNTNATFAKVYASYLLSRYHLPVFRATKVHFSPSYWNSIAGVFNGQHVAALGYDIESLITLQNQQLYMNVSGGSTSERYKVIGLTLKADLTNIQQDVIAEKMDDNTYWTLGDPVYGLLGSTTRLSL